MKNLKLYFGGVACVRNSFGTWEMTTTHKSVLWSEGAHNHPESEVKHSFYGERCHVPYASCPFCNAKWTPAFPSDTKFCLGIPEANINCPACDRLCFVEEVYSMSGLYQTRPARCEFLGKSCTPKMNAQYYYHDPKDKKLKHKAVQVFTCVQCERQLSYNAYENTLPAWREEYDDPDFFDPEGKLKVEVPEGGFKATPILDAIRNGEFRWVIDVVEFAGTLLQKHNEVYK